MKNCGVWVPAFARTTIERSGHTPSPVLLMSAPGRPSSYFQISAPTRGAERRETRERAIAPWAAGEAARDTVRRRLLPPCDRRKAPPGAPHATFFETPWAALPGSDGARVQAPYPEQWPPLVRRRRVQPIAPWSCGQPVVMPADGWPGPPECAGCVPSARGRRISRTFRSDPMSAKGRISGLRPTAAPPSQRPMTAPLASRTDAD